jgi:hypothetical protein
MAITDYIPNVFGSAAPTTYEGLLGMGLITPEQMKKQQNVANIQGLLGAGLALAQGMSKIGPRRSAAENILGAFAGGFGAAGGAYQQGLQNVVQQQQLQSAALTQKQTLDRAKAIEAAKLKYPDLAELALIDTGRFAEEVALRERVKGIETPTGEDTPESLRAQGQKLLLGGPNLAKAGETKLQQADTLELTNLSRLTGNETVDELRQRASRAIALKSKDTADYLIGVANAKQLQGSQAFPAVASAAAPVEQVGVPAFLQGQRVVTPQAVIPAPEAAAPVSPIDAQINQKRTFEQAIATYSRAEFANNPTAQKALENARASLPIINEEIKRLRASQISSLKGNESPAQLRELALFADAELGNKSLADELRNRANIAEYQLSQQPAPTAEVPAVPAAPAAEAPAVPTEGQLPEVTVVRPNRLAEIEASRETLVKRNEFLRKNQANPLFKDELAANKTAIEELDKQRTRALSSDLADNLPSLKLSAPKQFHSAIDNLQASISTGELSVKDATNEISTLQNKIVEYNQKELEFQRAQTNYQNEAYRVAQLVAPGVDPSKYTAEQIAEIQKRLVQQEKDLRIAGRTLLNLNVGNKKFVEEFGKGVAEGVAATQSQAISAQKTLSTISTIRPLIKAGVYAGPLSSSQLYIDRLASSFGFTSGTIDEKLARTSQTMQGLASLELDAASQMKGQGAITENERSLIARAAAGNLAQFTSGEVSTLLNALEKTANSKISAHNKNLERLRKNKDTAGLADFYELEGGNTLQDAVSRELEKRKGGK